MWNQGIATALLPMIGLFVGAVLQYYFGRALEARRQLAAQKSQSYADFFKAVALIAQHRSKENLAMAADAKVRVCVYGSPAVIRHLSKFEETGAAINSAESAAVITDLLREMRRDVGIDDRGIGQQDILNVLFGPQFGRGP